jgi:hypothetical protein
MEASANRVGSSFPAIVTRYAPKLPASICLWRDHAAMKLQAAKSCFDFGKSMIRYDVAVILFAYDSTRSAKLGLGWRRRLNLDGAGAVLCRLDSY